MTHRRHFHTFDALRFFAFLKVFLLHLPVTAFPVFNFIKNGGGTGVSFFFVLSGFLITYILLAEKEQTGTIGLKRFFIRRILRIWPLYYLMVLFAFLTPYLLNWTGLASSAEGYAPNWLMSLAFLENYQMLLTGDQPNVSPLGVTWSLCIEEHFYLVWGLAFYWIRPDKLPWLFGFCILTAMASRWIFQQNALPTIDLLSNFDFFAYGAFPAFWLVRHGARLEAFSSRIRLHWKILFVMLLLAYVIVSPHITYPVQVHVEPVLLGSSFAFLLVCILPEKNALKISDRNLLSRLGTYTYGLYLLHTVVINFLVQVFRRNDWPLEHAAWALVFSLSALMMTLAAAMASYHLFEKRFLKLRHRLGRRRLEQETVTAFATEQ